MHIALILPYLMALYPYTYVGTRLGVTATVIRLDGANANPTLRAGPLCIAQGHATLSSDATLSLDPKITLTLHAWGVSILDVAPSDDVFEVRAHVRFLGNVPMRPLRVQIART